MNSRMKIGILSVLLLALPILSLQASEQKATTLPSTVSEAIALALANRTELSIENTNVAVQKVGIKEARGAFFPEINFLSETQNLTQHDEYSGYNVNVDIAGQSFLVEVNQEPLPYTTTSTLELNYNLYAGGRDMAFMEKARAAKTIAEHQRDAVHRSISLEVMTAYWEARKAQIVLRIAMRWRDYHLASMQNVETKLKARQLAEVDQAIAQLSFQEQDLAAMQAKRDVGEHARKYQRVLGIKAIDDNRVRTTSVLPELVDDPEQDLAIQKTDILHHPQLLKMRADMVSARADIKAARSEYLPKLDLYARYVLTGRDSDDIQSAFEDYQSNHDVYGLRLTMNIFDGFKTNHRSRRAKLAENLARLRYEKTRQDVADAISEKSTLIEKARDDLKMVKQRLVVSEAKERVAKAQRKIGKYSDLEYRKVYLEMKEETDRVLIAKINLYLAKLRCYLVSLE